MLHVKYRIIRALDWIDDHILHHHVPVFCHWLVRSTWWDDED